MLKLSIKYLFLITASILLSSCGKSSKEQVNDAILSANILLSTSQCQPAIELLEGLGRQNKNAYYLKALASAYACRSGYSTVKFFADDIALTTTPAPLGGMSRYSTSRVSVTAPLTDDSSFRDLQTAIDILLYAGGIPATTEPTAIERSKYFNANQAGEINSQLAFMLLVQTGKLIKVYGDTDINGEKGGGSLTNNCFTNYSTVPAAIQASIISDGVTGACTSINSSHPQLNSGVVGRRKRLCEGVVLLNNILHVLPSVLASAGGGDLDAIATLSQEIEDQKDAIEAIDPTYTPTATVLSQTNCENDADINLDTLATYYAVFYETLIL